MGAAVVGLACCVALLALLVAGLTRRVVRAERLVDELATMARPDASRPERDPLVGAEAPAVRGVDAAGVAAEASADDRLLLAFLTGGCSPCRAFWSALAGGRRPGMPAVVVTPSPTTESSRAVAALAGGRVPVVMSSEAWLAYRVRGAPWFAVVDGGRVVAEGRVERWEDLEALAGG